MPRFLLHFAVPFVIFIPIFGLRKSIVLSLIALLPDLDYIIFSAHRSGWTHSFVTIGILTGVIIIVTSQKWRSKLKFAAASSFSLFSHLALDVFQDYTPAFWPLEENWIKINYTIRLDLWGSDIRIIAEEDFIIALILIVIPIILLLYRISRRK